MVWFVYVLKSETKDISYVGISQDLTRRLDEHNAGKSKFTSAYTPWKIVYSEPADSLAAARAREKYLKSAAGRRFIKKILL